MKKIIRSIFVILIVIGLGATIAIAGSHNEGTLVFGKLPLFTLCIIIAFGINWIAFVPAFIFQTEKFFDLIGSITYITVSIVSVLLAPVQDERTFIVLVLVVIWAIRLGVFLFKRILKDGKDGRFDELKPNFLRFLSVWTLQGLWVTLTLATALVTTTTQAKMPLGVFSIVGIIMWVIGFSIETIADTQKSKWRANKENKGKFIKIGLWSKSRHPNYFGEIIIWIGMAIIAFPVLQGWQFLTLVSPVFVIILLTRISGIPMLEKRADEKWGGDDDYEKYKRNTPILIPKL